MYLMCKTLVACKLVLSELTNLFIWKVMTLHIDLFPQHFPYAISGLKDF